MIATQSLTRDAVHLAVLTAVLLTLLLPPVAPAAAQTAPITIGATRIDNAFPNTLTFETTAVSSAGEIVQAELIYSTQRNLASNVGVRAAAEIVPGTPAVVRYVLDSGGAAVPSTPYLFKWRITDAAGNVAESPEELVRFDDTRYDWDVVENAQVSVWTHDRRAAFGEEVFDVANEAVARQRALFGEELTFPIYIIIYNDFEEFAEWQTVRREWVGGQAYPDLGITTQIVTDSIFMGSWLRDVIPHEISHLYFYQVSDNGAAPTPTWLNEGVAQYNEFHSSADAVQHARDAARNGRVLLLSTLESGFGGDDARILLAYDTAVSAVAYLVETYGEGGMADLLRAYRAGYVTREAFPQALGVSYDAFQRGWLAWLGVSPDAFPTPTVIALPTFRPSPTPLVLGQSGAGGDATPEVATPTTAALPTQTPESVVETAVVESTPTGEAAPEAGGGFCLPVGLVLPLLLVAGGPLLLRRRRSS